MAPHLIPINSRIFCIFEKNEFMIEDAQIIQQILRKIRRIPSSKLNDVNEYLSKLEQSSEKTSNILAYAGSWKSIEESTFSDLTENLIKNRNKNTRRFDE
jgi:hypothetical protein